MTRIWIRHRSSRDGSRSRTPHRDHEAHRAALRAELFRHFFLPAPEEIADPSWLSRLSVPIDLTRLQPADAERRKIERARARVARFRAVNHPQRQLRCLVLEMLDYMARELLCPGAETALEEWWAAARAYIRVLELPVMATPKARTLLPKILDARWPEVETVTASLARRYGPHFPHTDRATAQARINPTSQTPVNQGVIESWPTHNI